jgi:hypothetical protein
MVTQKYLFVQDVFIEHLLYAKLCAKHGDYSGDREELKS